MMRLVQDAWQRGCLASSATTAQRMGLVVVEDAESNGSRTSTGIALTVHPVSGDVRENATMSIPSSHDTGFTDNDFVILVTPAEGMASEISIAADDFCEDTLREIQQQHAGSGVRLISSPRKPRFAARRVWKMM